MAKVKEFDGVRNQPVIEDPRTGISALYFYGREVDKNTLSPKFDAALNFSYPAQTTTSAWTSDYISATSPSPAAFSYKYSNGQYLNLSKGSTSIPGSVNRPTTVSRSVDYKLDLSPCAWLDDTTKWSPNSVAILDNSTSDEIGVALMCSNEYNNRPYGRVFTGLNSNTKLTDKRPKSNDPSHSNCGRFFCLPKLSDNNYSILGWGRETDNNNYDYPTDSWKTWYQYDNDNFSAVQESTTYIGNYWTAHFLGYSDVSGDPIFFGTKRNSSTPYFNMIRYNTSTTTTPNLTQLASFSGAVTAGGTNQGGTSSISNRNMFASHWYDDPRVGAGTTKVFYRPWFDSYNNYHPTVITWDKTNDTFARSDDVTITGDLSSVHSDISGIFDESSSSTFSSDHFTLNETFVSGGTRYITVMHFQYQDCLDEGSRTWVTYSISPTDPTAFTYHSSTTIPVTPMNFCWLNDSRTLMAVLTGGITYIYAFNTTSGWTQTSTITDSIYEIGRDSLDRIWYVTASEKSGNYFTAIHLLTPTLPVSVTLTPASTNYTYAGSPINTTLTLNAINASGDRIATNVKVVIEGASMTFADGTTVKTIATSSTQDTTVNVIVTGAGYTNVTASIEI